MATGGGGFGTRHGKSRQRIRRIANAPDLTRVFIYLMSTYLQRIDRLRRATYADDLEMASIAEAIALCSIEPMMRDPGWRREYAALGKVVGVSGQRGVNALSVSQATGIPRETTRRKIKKLIAMGAITAVARGEYVMTPGFLQNAANPERITRAMTETIRFINEGLDQGFYEWFDAEK